MNGGIKMEREEELSSESYMNGDGTIKFKRSLGNGHWDRKLKANLVALSNTVIATITLPVGGVNAPVSSK